MRELNKLKYRVMASVNPTPRPNAKHRRLSSGRVPLYGIINNIKYKNLTVFNPFSILYGEIGLFLKIKESLREVG